MDAVVFARRFSIVLVRGRFDELRERVGEEVEAEEEEIPVRRGNQQKVAFTPRAYPNLAARDTFPQHKEPPMPKNKGGKAAGGDL